MAEKCQEARGDVRGSASDLVARTATQVSDCRQTAQWQIADDVAQQRRGEPFFSLTSAADSRRCGTAAARLLHEAASAGSSGLDVGNRA